MVQAPFVDGEHGLIYLPNVNAVTQGDLKAAFPLGEAFFALLFNFCSRFNAFRLLQPEIALFCALMIISPGLLQISSYIHSFIHSFYFYSASSSPLLLRSAPNPRDFGRKASNLPMRHHAVHALQSIYCIVLYLYIYIALFAVHTNQKRFQCERPGEKRAL